MKKDVIYIDIEDDITAVIEKLKASGEKIIALVPPKGNAVLQSVVNLKLLKRAAENIGKQPVIVTNNQALTALAGGLELYVAKNLQSKPALPGAVESVPEEEAVEVSDEEEAQPANSTSVEAPEDSDEVELSEEELGALESADAPPEAAVKQPKKKTAKGKKKVPNFDSFKKKLLIGGGIALLLLVILVAVFGRARASVVVRAATTPVDVAFDAAFNADATISDPETYNLKAQLQESKKTITQSFTATGQKDLGTKASGNMTLSVVCGPSTPPTIPAGTVVSSGSLNFVTQSSASLTTPSFSGGCRFNGNTTVVAQNNGDQYNLSSRSYSVAGFASVSGSGGQMSGGTSKIVKVVSQDDVNKARTQLEQQDTNQIRGDLKKAFGQGVTVFDDSFTTNLENLRSEPAVGEEANEARITADATYTILGVSDGDIGAALDAFITSQMTDKDQQRVYDNGFTNMKFEKIELAGRTAKYKVVTVGHYGPQFDTENLKEQIAGKKFGEARSYLQDLPGVKGVDIKLSPFWARTLPGSGRIQINLDVDKTTSG